MSQSILDQSIPVQSMLAQSELQAVPIGVILSMIQYSHHNHEDGIITPNLLVVICVKSNQELQS
jgi:hypothetical protein